MNINNLKFKITDYFPLVCEGMRSGDVNTEILIKDIYDKQYNFILGFKYRFWCKINIIDKLKIFNNCKKEIKRFIIYLKENKSFYFADNTIQIKEILPNENYLNETTNYPREALVLIDTLIDYQNLKNKIFKYDPYERKYNLYERY